MSNLLKIIIGTPITLKAIVSCLVPRALFYRVEILMNYPPPRTARGGYQTRLAKTTHCTVLPYTGGAGFARAFTTPPAKKNPPDPRH